MTSSCSKRLLAEPCIDDSIGSFSGSLATLHASVLRRRHRENTCRSLRPGATLGSRYRIVREIGRGSYGVVYEASDLLLGQNSVALKLFDGLDVGNSEQTSNFGREVIAMSRVTHPNVVRFYDVVRADGYIGYTMELVRGAPLSGLIHKGLQFSAREAGFLLRQLCHGVRAIHQSGIIHRDIKPANIIVTEEGALKIIDLGCSHLLGYPENVFSADRRYFQRRAIIGTPHYMAPEVLSGGEVSKAADVYGVAMVGYVLLTGRYPFSTKNFSRFVHLKCSKESPSLRYWNSECPEDLVEIVMKGVSRFVDERFESIDEVISELDLCPWLDEALQAGEVVPGLQVGARVRAQHAHSSFSALESVSSSGTDSLTVPLLFALAGILTGLAFHRSVVFDILNTFGF